MKSPSRFASLGLAVLALTLPQFVSAQSHVTKISTDYFPLNSPVVVSSAGTIYCAMSSNIRMIKTDGTFIADIPIPEMSGGQPDAAIGTLKFGPDGRLYGTTMRGFFSMNADGSGVQVSNSLSEVASYGNVMDSTPASDGKVYGIIRGDEILFSANPDGTGLSALHHFTPWGEAGPGDGPMHVMEGADGRLYGTMVYYGFNSWDWDTRVSSGGIYRVNKDGTDFTVIHQFVLAEGSFPGPLSQGPDGTLYAITESDGPTGSGTLFKLQPDGTGFAVICANNSDTVGYVPSLPLTIGANGRIYGVGQGGGALFSMLTDGSDAKIELSGSYFGGSSFSPPVLDSNGLIYSHTDNFLFSLDVSGRPFVQVNIGEMAGPIPEVSYGQVGQPFSYQITASNNPTSYAAYGLPAGLTLNASTGLISGTPLRSGVSSDIYFTATNAVGTSDLTPYFATTSPMFFPNGPGSAVRFVINPPDVPLTATVTISSLTATYDGTAKQATATTNPAGLNVVITYNGAPDLPIAIGSYAVVATIDDPDYAGSATGTLTIAALSAGPTLTLPANITAEATGKNGANVSFSASATDVITGNPRAVKYSKQPSSKFPLGTTTVTVTATGSDGKKATGTFTVTVRDTTAPTLSLPANIKVKAEKSTGIKVEFEPKARDAVDEHVRITASPASGSVFPIGITTVIVTATDNAGNSTSASFTVTVTKSQKDKDGKDCDDGKDGKKDGKGNK